MQRRYETRLHMPLATFRSGGAGSLLIKYLYTLGGRVHISSQFVRFSALRKNMKILKFGPLRLFFRIFLMLPQHPTLRPGGGRRMAPLVSQHFIVIIYILHLFCFLLPVALKLQLKKMKAHFAACFARLSSNFN